jgi:hypothetical protein
VNIVILGMLVVLRYSTLKLILNNARLFDGGINIGDDFGEFYLLL